MKEEEKTLTKLQQIEKALAGIRQKQSDSKVELAAIDKQAAELREKYKAAVEQGENDDALDKMDQELYKLDRRRTRVDIKLSQCGRDIEDMQRARIAAHALEERSAYESDVEAALLEAKEIEATVQILVGSAATHANRLEHMRRYAESVGVAQIPYRLENLERRVQTIFNAGHSVNKIYRKPYDEILVGNIEAVERQMGGQSPTSEPKTTDVEPTATAAN